MIKVFNTFVTSTAMFGTIFPRNKNEHKNKNVRIGTCSKIHQIQVLAFFLTDKCNIKPANIHKLNLVNIIT